MNVCFPIKLVRWSNWLIVVLGLTVQSVHASSQSAVSMPDAFSALAAKEVLEDGGNAIDAAITAQFVLAVTLPEAGNLGGGGFMLVLKDGQSDFIDYREKAPLAAHRDMYLDENGEVIANRSLFGPLASGVPGTVAGMWLAHQKYGSLPWARLVQPAVDLAERGFVMPAKLADYIASHSKRLKEKAIEVNFAKFFDHAKTGDLFVQPELAATLKRIRDQGREGFYQGKTADIITEFMLSHGGLITHKDLDAYQAVSRKPLQETWRGYELVTAAPPSSGGIAIIQWLKMYDLVKPSPAPTLNSSQYVHLLSEIGKRVFADRAEYLGDPDFYDVPKAQLLDPDYLVKRAAEVNPNAISATDQVAPGLHESEETTHFSVVDKWGNAVSNTTTINLGFGSSVVVEGAGFLLNDEMDDFSAKPGVANVFGAMGGVANEIQPQKRMLSSMTPTIVLENGKVKMVTGSPGGTTIISSVYLSILNALEFGLSAQEVVDTPRFHHQLWPKDTIRYHDGLPEQTVQTLEQLGYKMDKRHFGDMHVILEKDGQLQAGSESSGRGKAMVF